MCDKIIVIYCAGCLHIKDAKGLKEQISSLFPDIRVTSATDLNVSPGEETYEMVKYADILLYDGCYEGRGNELPDLYKKFREEGGLVHVARPNRCGFVGSNGSEMKDPLLGDEIDSLRGMIRKVQRYKNNKI